MSGKTYKLGYRLSVLNMAKDLNLSGYIQKIGDHTVYIEVEGIEPNVEKFVEWCGKNSSWSKSELFSVELSFVKNYNSFDLIHDTEKLIQEFSLN